MSSDKVKARLLKLLALARRGEGGEKEKAGNLLNRLLAEHNLTLEDLEREEAPRLHRDFAYQTKFEERLLRQIASQVLNTRRPQSWRYRGGQKIVIFDLTDVEYLEMKLRWVAYRAAWKKEQERFFHAFVNAQDIFPESPQDEARELSAEDLAEAEALMRMAAGISPVAIHRPLPSSQKGRT